VELEALKELKERMEWNGMEWTATTASICTHHLHLIV
jgi:hypothetical protein